MGILTTFYGVKIPKPLVFSPFPLGGAEALAFVNNWKSNSEIKSETERSYFHS